MVLPLRLESGNGRCVVTTERSPESRASACQEESWQYLKGITDFRILHKAKGEKKWAAPILDHILQDQSLDHNLVLDQDQDHILERRDTGLVPGHIQGLVVEIVFILEIIVEITGIIEE